MNDRLTRLMSGPLMPALAALVLAAGAWREGWGAAAQAHLGAAQAVIKAKGSVGAHPLLERLSHVWLAVAPGHDVAALSALGALSLVALAALVWWLGRALAGRLGGLLAAMMLVLHPDVAAAMAGPGPTLPLATLMVAHVALLVSERLGWRRWPLVALVGALLNGSMIHAAPWWLATLLVWLLVEPTRREGGQRAATMLPLGMLAAVGVAALAPLLHPAQRALGLKDGWWAALKAALLPAAEAARFGGGWFGDAARLPAWAGPARALSDWPLVCTAGVFVGLWALKQVQNRRAAWLVGVTLSAGLLLPWISGSWLIGRAEIAALIAPWAAVVWGVGCAWSLRRAHAYLAELNPQRAPKAAALAVVLIATALCMELAIRAPWHQGSALARAVGCWPLRPSFVPAALAREVPADKAVFALAAQPDVLQAAGGQTRFVASPQQADVIIIPGWQRTSGGWEGWEAAPLGPASAPAWWMMTRR